MKERKNFDFMHAKGKIAGFSIKKGKII